MNYEATTLKAIFADLITIDITRNLEECYQLKQDAIENVWSTISTLERNGVHTYAIKSCIDELACALEFLEEIKTRDDINHITLEIRRVIDMLEREVA